MNMNLDVIFDFKRLYMIAKDSFKSCIRDPENSFLNDELTFNILDIIIQEEYISIKIMTINENNLTKEVSLSLLSPEYVRVGTYKYILDNKDEFLDEFLTFFKNET